MELVGSAHAYPTAGKPTFAVDGTQIVLQFETEADGAVTGEDLSHRYLWQANAVDQLLADEQLLPSPSGRGAGG